MSSDWRARLGSFAAGLGFNRLSDDFSDDAEATGASGETTAGTSRLRRVLDDLKAGDPNAVVPSIGNSSNGTPSAELAAPAVEPVAVEPVAVTPVAVQPAIAEPAKAPIEEKPKAEVAKFTASAPVLNGERKAETAMSDDVFLLVAEQRKAAEALLPRSPSSNSGSRRKPMRPKPPRITRRLKKRPRRRRSSSSRQMSWLTPQSSVTTRS